MTTGRSEESERETEREEKRERERDEHEEGGGGEEKEQRCRVRFFLSCFFSVLTYVAKSFPVTLPSRAART